MIVRPKWWKWCDVLKLCATAAATVESAKPANEASQNGTTSFIRCERPALPQAHRRFR